MIKDAQIRGSLGFCLRRHGGRILAGTLDLRIASSTQSAVPRFPAREPQGHALRPRFQTAPQVDLVRRFACRAHVLLGHP